MTPGTRGALAAVLASLLLAVAAGAVAAGAGTTPLDDLLFDLQLAPLDGAEPPAFTLEDLDGGRVSLADFKGRVVFLYFWAGW